jgi:hypothetical protein
MLNLDTRDDYPELAKVRRKLKLRVRSDVSSKWVDWLEGWLSSDQLKSLSLRLEDGESEQLERVCAAIGKSRLASLDLMENRRLPVIPPSLKNLVVMTNNSEAKRVREWAISHKKIVALRLYSFPPWRVDDAGAHEPWGESAMDAVVASRLRILSCTMSEEEVDVFIDKLKRSATINEVFVYNPNGGMMGQWLFNEPDSKERIVSALLGCRGESVFRWLSHDLVRELTKFLF